MQFTKMHGAGNDYIYVDCFTETLPDAPEKIAPLICDRHFGVGSDGLILIMPSEVADARMRMFNADGSEAEMCGNGIRCVAKYVYDHQHVVKEVMDLETGAGILKADLTIENDLVSRVKINMGEPILAADKIPTKFSNSPVVNQKLEVAGQSFDVTCVSMGNPHCVIFVEEATDELVLGLGKQIENSPMFPARINVEFVEIISPTELRQRTWERGSGETLACGTGAAAVCVAGVLTSQTERKVLIHLLGGDLELFWNPDDNHVYKTGPAAEVFSGIWQQKASLPSL